MNLITFRNGILSFLLIIHSFIVIFGQTTPPGFIDELVSSNWDTPVGLTFDANGRMYVWEKGGRVHIVENGVKRGTPLINISEEVLDYIDHGLNGFALDPNFLTNGYIYLLYVADRNYIDNYGTGNYSTANNDKFEKATIGRIVRYTANSNDNFNSVVSGSRLVLLGNTLSTGIPIVMDNHGVGSLVFAPDGSLLFSVGDVAFVGNNETESFFQEAQNAGILTAQTRVSSYRSQLTVSLNGKINRINPATGQGYSSNPFYNASSPASPQSMVWCLGLRNPFRFTIKPNTGSLNPNDGNVGVLYIGDVGWASREEINVAPQKGMNFGWPTYEGELTTSMNNPTYTPTNPIKPKVMWRGPIAQSFINNEFYDVGSPQFLGNNFTGGSSIGGIWYTGNAYPAAYQNQYFQGDYTNPGWVKGFKFDANHQAIEVTHFAQNVHPTCFSINPTNQLIYYISYEYPSTHQIRRILHDPNYNMPPVAVMSANPQIGNSPLTVNFSSAGSNDPEGGSLSYSWDFGNGQTSSSPNPSYTYYSGSPQVYTAKLRVTDNVGKYSETTIPISVNNMAPNVVNTSLDNVTYFPNNANALLYLEATATDEDPTDALVYEWRAALHHEDHVHSVGNTFGKISKFRLDPVPCDGQSYFYRISLKVTDKFGVSTTVNKDISPICTYLETTPPSSFGIKATSVSETSAIIQWPAVTDDTEIWGYEIFKNGTSLGIVKASVLSFKLTDLRFNSTNKFKIKAIDKYGNSTESEEILVKNAPPCASNSAYVSDLSWANSVNGIGPVERDKSNGGSATNDGSVINIIGTTYQKGIGTFPYSRVTLSNLQNFKKLKGELGLSFTNSSSTCGSVVYRVKKNGADLFNSNIIKYSGRKSIELDVSNSSQLELIVEDAGDNNWCDEANWANLLLSSCLTIDNQCPTIVQGISTTKVDNHTYTLNWGNATDNDAITYTIYVDGDSLSTISANTLVLSNLTYGIHQLFIQATDINRNASVSALYSFEVIDPCPNSKEIVTPYAGISKIQNAAQFIEASNVINNNSNIIYNAGNSILLTPGFKVENSVFLAQIQDCINE